MNILSKNLMTLLACLTVMLVNLPLRAATIYDESVDGDLIDGIKVSPWISPGDSVGVLPLGSSVVNGVFGKPTGALVEDTDTLTFEIAAGTQLDSIQLGFNVLDGHPGGGSYFAIQDGPSIGTGITTVGSNLSNKLISASGELLAIFATGPDFGGVGITTPLAAGQYTLWMSETAAEVGYSLDFNVTVVPEPAAAVLVIFAAVPLLRRKRN